MSGKMAITFMYSLDEENYLKDYLKILKSILKSESKICYITFNRTAESLKEYCQKNGMDSSKLIVIDMISPRFMECADKNNIYYPDINDLVKDVKSVIDIIARNNRTSLLIDTMSSMQVYYDNKT